MIPCLNQDFQDGGMYRIFHPVNSLILKILTQTIRYRKDGCSQWLSFTMLRKLIEVGIMLAYPIHLEPDDNDTFLVTSPDFPELTTFGDDREEALARAVDALEEAIAARMYNRQDIPCPSQGADCVTLPALITAKVMLYQWMRNLGIGKAELARRLGWTLTQVDRAMDINHRSRLDDMDVALRAVGCQLTVTALSA